MRNETIDKLKIAGYITSTDDSQGIADKVGITPGPGPGPIDPDKYKDKYFAIEVLQNYAFIGFLSESNLIDGCSMENLAEYMSEHHTLEYRVNESDWVTLVPDPDVYEGGSGGLQGFFAITPVSGVTFNAGDRIEIRHTGSLQQQIIDPEGYNIGKLIFRFSFSPADINGNIMSLLYGEDFEDETSLISIEEFWEIFNEAVIRNARGLVLPATTLTERCYNRMFYAQSSLITAPAELPATTLAADCYESMFNGCVLLTTAPELPATTLADGCYCNMFDSCFLLTTAPELPATILTENCYQEMFNGCASLTVAPELPATTLTENCYQGMFAGCPISSVRCLAEGVEIGNSNTLADEINNLLTETIVNIEVNNYTPIGTLIDNQSLSHDILLTKRIGQNIDFYYPHSANQPYVQGVNTFLAHYLDLNKIWDEVGDTDPSAYHISLEGAPVDNVSRMLVDEVDYGLEFSATNEELGYIFRLFWGYDHETPYGTNFACGLYAPTPYVPSDWTVLPYINPETGETQSIFPWSASGITEEMYNAWMSKLESLPNERTADLDTIREFKIGIGFTPGYPTVPSLIQTVQNSEQSPKHIWCGGRDGSTNIYGAIYLYGDQDHEAQTTIVGIQTM